MDSIYYKRSAFIDMHESQKGKNASFYTNWVAKFLRFLCFFFMGNPNNYSTKNYTTTSTNKIIKSSSTSFG